MKIEITDEQLQSIIDTHKRYSSLPYTLAKALQEERAERKAMHEVWENAPEWATRAVIHFSAGQPVLDEYINSKEYTRTLPKLPERLIAEKYFSGEAYIVACEAAILEAKGC